MGVAGEEWIYSGQLTSNIFADSQPIRRKYTLGMPGRVIFENASPESDWLSWEGMTLLLLSRSSIRMARWPERQPPLRIVWLLRLQSIRAVGAIFERREALWIGPYTLLSGAREGFGRDALCRADCMLRRNAEDLADREIEGRTLGLWYEEGEGPLLR